MLVAKLALIVLAVLTAASSAPGDEKEINQWERSQTYQHTYGEVFQASQQAIERRGMFVTASDKDKGIVSGTSADKTTTSFNIHVEALNTKPETRVTFQCKWSYRNKVKQSKALEQAQRDWIDRFLVDIQKVLSTY